MVKKFFPISLKNVSELILCILIIAVNFIAVLTLGGVHLTQSAVKLSLLLSQVFVTQQPNWTHIFSGESITLTCEVQGGETTEWMCGWRRSGSIIHWTDSKDWTFIVSESSSGNYMCQCRSRDDWYSTTQWSETIRLSVSSAILTIDPNWSTFHPGERVTFICDMNEGKDTDWEYEIKRNREQILHSNPHKSFTLLPIQIDHGGEYQCCGHRKSSDDTKCSDTVSLTVTAQPRATLTAGPTTIPVGGSVTLSCFLPPTGGWKYKWFRKTKNTPEVQLTDEENRDINVAQAGIYRCLGMRGNENYHSLVSDEEYFLTRNFCVLVPFKVTVTLDHNWPRIYGGETVTIRCEIQGGGQSNWTYECRKNQTIEKTGTSSEYRIIKAKQSDSGEYSCRGRRDRFSSTEWSDAVSLTVYFQPGPSLKVNPERVQHFSSDSVSFHCEGNSTAWRLMRVTETGQHSRLNSSNWVTGQESIINNWSDGGIFWCETGLGEFSNAVNITLQNDYHDGVILVSPVHPVTEGDPVTLSCRDKKQNLLSNVFFYHNNKLINNDGREELKISAVSKSDEGFYKCQHSGKESPRSWMSVRVFLANVPSPVGSSSNVLLIIGPCSGILLIVLLFLCYYIRSKGETFYSQHSFIQHVLMPFYF
uniref:Ig-like domain-containing protein n=1 Tax=Xiphophorus maculatus TaxID=8083 RepID=A0A3B5QAH1_XIPMA